MAEIFKSKTMVGKLLELEMAGPSEKRYKVESMPKSLAWHNPHDGKDYRVRELLLSDASESTTLIQEQVFNQITEGAKVFTCAREAAPVLPCRSNAMRVNLGAAGTYASEVAEGAEVPQGNQDYSKVTINIKKVGVNAAITEEMLEDGLFDAAAMELKYAGEACENKMNRDWLSNVLENSYQAFDTAGSNQGIKAITKAIGLVRAQGFEPDYVVMHPKMYAITMLDYVPAYNESAEGVLRDGALPTVAGLKAVMYGGADDSATYTWDYDGGDEIGALVINKQAASAIAMARDITVKEMKDPVHDIVNLPVTMRYGSSYKHKTATCRIQY